MMKLFAYIAIFSLLPCALALAQSTDAARYTNGQGVEVIQNRPPPGAIPAPLAVPAAVTAAAGAGGATVDKPAQSKSSVTLAPGAQQSAPVRDARFQIPPVAQREADTGRLEILQQELQQELADAQSKSKVLSTPSMRENLDEKQQARIKETLRIHERNILDLNSEINRLMGKSARRQ